MLGSQTTDSSHLWACACTLKGIATGAWGVDWVADCRPQVRSHLPPGVDGWGYSLKGLMGLVVIGGLLITLTYFILQRAVVPKYASHTPLCPAFSASQHSSASNPTSQRLALT